MGIKKGNAALASSLGVLVLAAFGCSGDGSVVDTSPGFHAFLRGTATTASGTAASAASLEVIALLPDCSGNVQTRKAFLADEDGRFATSIPAGDVAEPHCVKLRVLNGHDVVAEAVAPEVYFVPLTEVPDTLDLDIVLSS